MGDLAAVRSFVAADGTVGPEASFTCRTRFLSLTTRSHQHAAARDVVSDAMYAAVRHSRTEVARFLLPRGVNLRSHAFVGATLLHWACYGGARVIVDLLIDGGADPDARDDSLECTPRAFSICAPARLGDLARVSARLRDDPSLATIDTGRGTPLHEAARGGHEEIVRLLLAHGADPHARDRNGRLPRDLADKASETWIEVLL
jgi:ankyrin repeat protein